MARAAPLPQLLLRADAAAAAAVSRLEVTRRDAQCAVVAVAGWLVALLAAPRLLHHDRFDGGIAGVWTVVALLVAVVLACIGTNHAAAHGKK